MVRIAKGQNLTLSPLAVALRIEEYPRYEREATSDGIPRNIGGATALMSAEALSYDEADELLNQCGVNLYIPAAEITIELPDLYRIPTMFYGVIELEVYQTEGDWWVNFRLKLSGLVPVWL